MAIQATSIRYIVDRMHSFSVGTDFFSIFTVAVSVSLEVVRT